jgi:DNA-binding GntR family transcriptional regulator
MQKVAMLRAKQPGQAFMQRASANRAIAKRSATPSKPRASGEAGNLIKKQAGRNGKSGAVPATLKDEVVRLIEEQIIAGELPPGMRLDEVQLAKRFGLSRTPLREALAQLAASGMVESQPRGGTYVTRLGIKSILECLAMTAEIEGIAADWAARRMTAAEIDALAALHDACEQASRRGHADAYFLANRKFHSAIYAGAHNRYVAETANFLFLRAAPYRRLQLRQPGRILSSFDEHGAIVDAIRARDGETAKRITRDHILIQGDRFMEFISMLPSSYIGLESD